MVRRSAGKALILPDCLRKIEIRRQATSHRQIRIQTKPGMLMLPYFAYCSVLPLLPQICCVYSIAAISNGNVVYQAFFSLNDALLAADSHICIAS